MTFTRPFFLWVEQQGVRVAVGVTVVVLLSGIVVLRQRPAQSMPPVEGASMPAAESTADPDARLLEGLQGQLSVFRARRQEAVGRSFGAAFRFAGTFSVYGHETGEGVFRRAVVAYRPTGKQYIVSEGDEIEAVRVHEIGAQELLLEKGGTIVRLSLAGVEGTGTQDEPDARDAGSAGQDTAAGVASTSRFGEQTEAGIWRMEREALLAYYEELLDEPERLLQVFDSMQPLYTESGSIEGYRLEPVGEEEFFADVGFQEGDTVRSVNALPMTNRRRAEFFIRQVVENDMSAVVIDLEREGEPVRMVYEIR